MNTIEESVGPVFVSDVTGQKSVVVETVPSDQSIQEAFMKLIGPLHLSSHDAEGRPLNFAVRSEREGRFLGPNEKAGDSLLPNDHLRLMPSIEAGGSV